MGQFADRARRTEIEPLHLRAAFGPNEIELLLSLDALSGGFHAETGAQACYGADDGGSVRAGRDFSHERSIDLDFVEWKRTEVAKRGITRAEIVERNAHPETAPLMKRAQRGLGLLQQDRFCYFQFQSPWSQPSSRQRGDHHLRQAAASELSG